MKFQNRPTSKEIVVILSRALWYVLVSVTLRLQCWISDKKVWCLIPGQVIMDIVPLEQLLHNVYLFIPEYKCVPSGRYAVQGSRNTQRHSMAIKSEISTGYTGPWPKKGLSFFVDLNRIL